MRLLLALLSKSLALGYLGKKQIHLQSIRIVRLKLYVYGDGGKNQTRDNAENDCRIIQFNQTQQD